MRRVLCVASLFAFVSVQLPGSILDCATVVLSYSTRPNNPTLDFVQIHTYAESMRLWTQQDFFPVRTPVENMSVVPREGMSSAVIGLVPITGANSRPTFNPYFSNPKHAALVQLTKNGEVTIAPKAFFPEAPELVQVAGSTIYYLGREGGLYRVTPESETEWKTECLSPQGKLMRSTLQETIAFGVRQIGDSFDLVCINSFSVLSVIRIGRGILIRDAINLIYQSQPVGPDTSVWVQDSHVWVANLAGTPSKTVYYPLDDSGKFHGHSSINFYNQSVTKVWPRYIDVAGWLHLQAENGTLISLQPPAPQLPLILEHEDLKAFPMIGWTPARSGWVPAGAPMFFLRGPSSPVAARPPTTKQLLIAHMQRELEIPAYLKPGAGISAKLFAEAVTNKGKLSYKMIEEMQYKDSSSLVQLGLSLGHYKIDAFVSGKDLTLDFVADLAIATLGEIWFDRLKTSSTP